MEANSAINFADVSIAVHVRGDEIIVGVAP